MSTYCSTSQERYFLHNTLAILLKAVEGERTTVDLRNESSICGVVEQADGFMNIIMKDCLFTDPRGDNYKYEIFFVQARNIRYVHIPAHIRIIPSINEQLEKLDPPKRFTKQRTFKSKRAAARQAEGLAAVNKFLKAKEEKSAEDSTDPQPGGSKSGK